jgi:hypothetical protein
MTNSRARDPVRDDTPAPGAQVQSPRPAPSVAEIARRLDRYAATKDPSELWPGLTEGARVAAVREIERVTRLVLAGRTNVLLDPANAHDPYAHAVAGFTSGMGPLVGRWIEDGVVDAAPGIRDTLLDHLARSRRLTARIEREVVPAFDALISHGITPIVLKGFHTGRVYHEEPGVRRMGDVDLLVPPARIREAEWALFDAGFRPDSEPLRPYRRDWIGRDVDPRIYSIDGPDERGRWMLELHGSLDRRLHPGAVVRLDSEAGNVQPFEIAGRPVEVLGQPLLLVSLACHCSQELDGSRLLRLVELVRVIRRDTGAGRLDWDTVVALLHRTRAARYAYPAFALAEDLAPDTVDPRVLMLGRRASTWAARHTVARLVPAGGSLDERGALRQLMWTRGTVAVLQRILRNVWPASFVRPTDVFPGWRVRLRRMRAGLLSLRAPDERRTAITPDARPPSSHSTTAERESREART